MAWYIYALKREEFDRELAKLSPRDQDAIEALGSTYLAEIREALDMLVRYAAAGPPAGPRARSVLSQVGEAAEASLSRAIASAQPPQSWMLLELDRGVEAAEQAAVARLRAALGDHRQIQPRPTPFIEEPEPAFRVRDEAYLALRRIGSSETALTYLTELRHFLTLPDADKDREIQHYLQTGLFSRFLGNQEEDNRDEER